MIEHMPLIISLISAVVVFYILGGIVFYMRRELQALVGKYSKSLSEILKQMHQIENTMKTKVDITIDKLEQASLQHRQTTSFAAQNIKELVGMVYDIERTISRQKELEDEIVRLKSILARKEKQNATK